MTSVLRTRTRANDLEAAGGRGGRPLRSGAEAGCGLGKGGGAGKDEEEEERRAAAVKVETSFAETAAVKVVAAAAVVEEKALLLLSAAVAISAPRSTRVASSKAFLRGGAGAARRPGRASGVTRGREEEFRPLPPPSSKRGRGTAIAAVAVEEANIIGCCCW